MSEDLLDICMEQKASFYVLSLLARREYSQYELRQKLIAKAYPTIIIDKILTELIQQDIQSDLRCANMLLHHGYKNKWGPNKIIYQMRQKEISEDIIFKIMQPKLLEPVPSSLAELKELLAKPIDNANLLDIKLNSQDWCEQANQLAVKKFGHSFLDTLKNDLKNKAKLQRFLYNRGFKQEHINFVIQFYNSKT